MSNFIHRWLNPHCPHCIEEKREALVCNSCEVLKLEIERLRLENDKLLNKILNPPVPIIETKVNMDELKPLGTRNIPWAVRRETLEAEDRAKAKLMKEKELQDFESILLESDPDTHLHGGKNAIRPIQEKE